MKTAMQELIERYYLFENGEYKPDAFKKHFAEFYPLHLLKEKEQIIDAHIEGQRVFDNYPHTQWTNDQAEQYYNQTYNQNK
jgi:hypothetical protein